MQSERLDRLERALGYQFVSRELLQQALTHRSYGSGHNKRIAFLGVSILICVVAARVFAPLPTLREGELSRLRAALVRQETLAMIAQELSLGDYMRLGEGELKSGGFRRPSILADALEAIFGSVYLDAGFEAAFAVVSHLFEPQLMAIDPKQAFKDPKTSLQELLQGRRMALPQYTLRATRGDAHAQEFEVECRIPALDIVVYGTGSSRRAAEQDAARRICQTLDGK